MKLELLRNKIDLLDKKIIDILTKRTKFVKRIALIKQLNKIKVIDFRRETELMDKILTRAEKLGLDKEFISRLFDLIIKESKRIQKQGK